MIKLKIILIGPYQSGKTMIANVLSEVNDNLELRPTKAARIVEFEVSDIKINLKNTTALIELWDCSGEQKYNYCWPAIRNEANGVILVHSESNLETQQELEVLYNYFIVQNGLASKHCVIFNNGDESNSRLGSHFARMSQIKIDLSNTEMLRKDFNEFVTSLLVNKSETVLDT